MVHLVMEGLLSVVIAILIIRLLLYRRQVKDIGIQLCFTKEEDTNHKISIALRGKEWVALQDELNELLEEQRLRKLRLLAEEKKLMDMVTNVSHDIRTPLTSISGYFQMYCESDNEENKKRYQAVINGRLKALAEMLEEFFTYFKIKDGQSKGALGVCDVQQILYETVFLFYEDMTKNGMEPKFFIPEEKQEIIADEKAVRRVFFNIIKNALVHGTQELSISMNVDAKHIGICFKNKTNEQLPDDINNVFERFVSGDKSRNNGSTGLGLSIAKELVMTIGGEIRAFTEEDFFGIEVLLPRKA